ncbi:MULTISPECIES: hypothetical protein [unclassified Rhizobium]|uniref:hypothetical protein n=1 Tax=unclassified Rhizobium TaxID=2613769 RepID=UPI00161AA2D4|nr:MULTISPECIES: hypothetical protein [unclassified Rhizobium]MBB3545164.1 hypothetical protein [Rhizobium sp. BK399]MCS3743578.1 hypothetical protein [Rhizobium sp. BK661]MCS4096536.1 hypothetical protein [Rhizobium sp. BK176]
MTLPALTSSELKTLSVAVQNWYRHYCVPLDTSVSCLVCVAAIEIYHRGVVNVDDISGILIARLSPGSAATQAVSDTIH